MDERSPDYGEALTKAAQRIHVAADKCREMASEAGFNGSEDEMANGLDMAEHIIHEEYSRARWDDYDGA